MENKKFDLEDRLIKFACMCLDVCDLLPNTKTGQNLKYSTIKKLNFLIPYFLFHEILILPTAPKASSIQFPKPLHCILPELNDYMHPAGFAALLLIVIK